MHIHPSLISSDLLDLKATIKLLDPHCKGYHLDVMDDHFVPNLTWGPSFINAIRQTTNLSLYVHLMVDNPFAWPDRLELKHEDTIVFHYEALPNQRDQKKLIDHIHSKGILAGIALNPNTSVDLIADCLPLIDSVLVMSVEPGFSGQAFIPHALNTVKRLDGLRIVHKYRFSIAMDGGINERTIKDIANHNVDIAAAASALFSKPDPIQALRKLYELIQG